jgi:hypothetical protein
MNKNIISRLIVAFLVTLTLLIASCTMAQVTPAGSATSLTGDVHIERHGTTVPATPRMTVDVGDRVVTGANSRVTIKLTDNSKLELDESASLVIDNQAVTAAQYQTKPVLGTGAFIRVVRVVADAELRGAYAQRSCLGPWH